jgi:ankyrin repeat protein
MLQICFQWKSHWNHCDHLMSPLKLTSSGEPGGYARLDGNTTQTAQFLAQEGGNVNQCDNDGWTPLHHAIATGNTKVCQLLVEKGADVNLVNRLGETALMFCAKHSNFEVATLLIESGADVNQENRDGWTSLTYCARYCDSAQIAKLLIYYWAKVNQPDRLGWPPLTHCALAGGKLVAEALVCNGAGVTLGQGGNYNADRQASASESESNAVI